MNTQMTILRDRWSIWIENIKNIVQIIALIVAGWWTYTTYVLPELYRPDDYRPDLFAESKTESIRVLSDRAVVSLSMHVSNQSKRFIHNLGAHYQINGLRNQSNNGKIKLDAISEELNKNKNSLRHWDILPRQKTETISVGRIMPDDWWFAPGERYKSQIVIPVPCNVDVIQMNMSVLYHYGDEKTFEIEWKEGETEKEGEEFLWFTVRDKENKEVNLNNHGLQWTMAVNEIDIPCRRQEDGSVASNTNKNGGH